MRQKPLVLLLFCIPDIASEQGPNSFNYPPSHQFVIKIFQHSANVLKNSIPFFHFIWRLFKTFTWYCSIFPYIQYGHFHFSFLKLWISGLRWWKMNCWPFCLTSVQCLVLTNQAVFKPHRHYTQTECPVGPGCGGSERAAWKCSYSCY